MDTLHSSDLFHPFSLQWVIVSGGRVASPACDEPQRKQAAQHRSRWCNWPAESLTAAVVPEKHLPLLQAALCMSTRTDTAEWRADSLTLSLIGGPLLVLLCQQPREKKTFSVA